MVAMSTEMGTTPATMSRLERSSADMLATVNASTKLPHCGSLGQARPVGTVPRGCSAADSMLRNGSSVTTTNAIRNTRPVSSSRRLRFIPCPPW
jgi:hypothetical protein